MKLERGLLIFPILKDMNTADGIVTKNEGIKKGFIQNDIDPDVLEFTTEGIFNGREKIYSFSRNRYRRIYQYHVKIWEQISNYVAAKKYQFIWFRIPVVNSAISRFVHSVKRDNPACRIILEYGAYPFVNELGLLKKSIYLLNKAHEKKVHRLADFVITYGDQQDVDGVINIPIDNGIDLDNVPVIAREEQAISPINFISVSSLKKWHAYERFILGMAEYIKGPNPVPIHFNIVGNGPEYGKLLSLVNELNLEAYVTFHDFRTGNQLDKIYNENHVAISTLGFHRIGLTKSSSLKNREYFARGLPVVLSTLDKDLPSDLPFVKYVLAGENVLNVSEVVDFAVRAYSIPHLHKTIREYAEENLSWRNKIKTVLYYLNGGKNEKKLEETGSLVKL